MITGKKLKARLEEGRETIEREHVDVSRKRMKCILEMEELGTRQTELWWKFASVQISQGGSGGFTSEKLEKLKSKRARKIDDAHLVIDELSKEIPEAKARLEVLWERREKSAAILSAKVDEVHIAAGKDEEVLSIRARLADLGLALSSAEARKRGADADLKNKGKDYDDELFAYLSNRKYGTDEYRARPIIATLDALLASAIGFEKAMQDYRLLTGLPGWIESKLEELRGKLDDENRRLAEAMAKYEVGLPPLKKELQKIDQEISAASAALESAELRKHAVIEWLAKVADGADELQKEIIEECVASLKNQKTAALARLADQTPSADDDAALEEIQRIDGAIAALRARAQSFGNEMDRLTARLSEMKEVERKLKNAGWNNSDHRFKDMFDVGQLAKGHIRSDAFWVFLTQAHVPPPPEPVRSSSSSWSTGGISRSNDSWSTGGSFGDSGSWSTGGSFGGGSSSSSSGGGF